uniref:EH domain-containing protein n=1 Tax=Aegilops tauschii subsp. strangulata TaxID=200361 RepID=A0A453ST30_AEGTS
EPNSTPVNQSQPLRAVKAIFELAVCATSPHSSRHVPGVAVASRRSRVLPLLPLSPSCRGRGDRGGKRGAMEIGGQHPASSCSKEHQKIYRDWFALADSDGDGRITGPDAIKFFAMSSLPRADLKQVWAIADSKRLGYLGFGEFITAMQLVSLAQAGNEISQDSLQREGCC